jgi:RNA polymerase sigma factor (sigma-70 family)
MSTLPSGTPAPHDRLLAPIAACTDDGRRDELIAAVIEVHGLPVIRRSLRARLRISDHREVEDLQAQVVMRVFRRLREMDLRDPIKNFTSYVALAAYHAADDYLRAKYPQRAMFRNRIRYLTSHDERFAQWSINGELVCGAAATEGQAARQPVTAVAVEARDLAGSLLRLFAAAAGPLLLEDVVACFPESAQFTDVEPMAEPDVLERLELREAFAELWREIEALPPRQRAALLLNLRDRHGSSILSQLAGTDVTQTQIAAAIGVSIGKLTAIWDDLPLNDQIIAERLGVTRQQVINLRKSARDRLARRLRSNTKSFPPSQRK